MLKILDHKAVGQRGAIIIPGVSYLHRGILIELAKVLKYYRNNPASVLNNHILVTILNALQLNFKLPYDEYYYRTYDETMQLTQVLRLTSPIYSGGVQKVSTFYNSSVREILTTLTYDIDIPKSIKNWENLQPVKVFRQPFNDITLSVPNGKYPFECANGLAVINIDIPMLALMYRCWYELESKINSDFNAHRTTRQFIAMYVLPNILFTQLDHCIFNRMAILEQKDVSFPYYNTHPFVIIDYSKFLDSWIKGVIKIILDKTMNFTMLLSQIPLFTHTSLYKLFELPSYPQTRHIDWAILVSKTQLINFLLNIDERTKGQWNKDLRNSLIIDLKELYSDKMMFKGLPQDIRDNTEAMLKRGLVQTT